MRQILWSWLAIVIAILAGLSIVVQLMQVVRGGITAVAHDLKEELIPTPLTDSNASTLTVRQLQRLWHSAASARPDLDEHPDIDKPVVGTNFKWFRLTYKIVEINPRGFYYKSETALRHILRLRGALDEARVLLTEAQREMLAAGESASALSDEPRSS